MCTFDESNSWFGSLPVPSTTTTNAAQPYLLDHRRAVSSILGRWNPSLGRRMVDVSLAEAGGHELMLAVGCKER